MKTTLLSLLLLSSCSQSNTTAPSETEEIFLEEMEEPVEEAFISKTISHEDSIYVLSLIDVLKGIEKFALGNKENDFYLLSAILTFKKDAAHERVRELLNGVDEYPNRYGITELDPKNGYIQYVPFGAEATYTTVYRNLKDGSQLIAYESMGCGGVCDSDIYFYKYEEGKYSKMELTDVIPEIGDFPPPIDEYGDPLERQFILPRHGKDIRYCIEQQEEYEECITLKWDDGKFKITS